jgi:hypothetical protein
VPSPSSTKLIYGCLNPCPEFCCPLPIARGFLGPSALSHPGDYCLRPCWRLWLLAIVATAAARDSCWRLLWWLWLRLQPTVVVATALPLLSARGSSCLSLLRQLCYLPSTSFGPCAFSSAVAASCSCCSSTHPRILCSLLMGGLPPSGYSCSLQLQPATVPHSRTVVRPIWPSPFFLF